MSTARLGAIVLAAGRGERMGGPKALLLLGGKPLLLHHVDRFLEAGCDEIVVVTREEIATRLLSVHERVRVVVSAEPEPRGSLSVGVRALAPLARVFVTPVDAVPAEAATLAELSAALENADAATPSLEGRGGHPVACRARVLAPYRAGEACRAPTLRDTLRALGDRRVRVPVADRAVGIDLDTPDDVARLTGAPPEFWRPESS